MPPAPPTHPSAPAESPLLWPATPSPTCRRFFAIYLRRLLGKSFFAVRLAPGTREALAAIELDVRPAIVLINHASWWDPLVGLWLGAQLTPTRPVLGPMELAQLKKFAIFRKLGIFGINPDQPGSLAAMTDYLRYVFATAPRTAFWVTPQGQFADVRDPIRIRPGAAAAAARLGDVVVATVAVEYVFWTDQRPEVLVRAVSVQTPPTEAGISTASWTRAMQLAMQANADALATLSRSRDTNAFETYSGGGRAKVHPVFDLWMRLRGRDPALVAANRGMAARSPKR